MSLEIRYLIIASQARSIVQSVGPTISIAVRSVIGPQENTNEGLACSL